MIITCFMDNGEKGIRKKRKMDLYNKEQITVVVYGSLSGNVLSFIKAKHFLACINFEQITVVVYGSLSGNVLSFIKAKHFLACINF